MTALAYIREATPPASETTVLGRVTDPAEWSANPGANLARAVGCGLLLPLCLAGEASARAKVLRREVEARVSAGTGELAAGVRATGGELRETLRASAAPLEQAANLADAIAIGLIAIAVMLGLSLLFYVLRMFR